MKVASLSSDQKGVGGGKMVGRWEKKIKIRSQKEGNLENVTDAPCKSGISNNPVIMDLAEDRICEIEQKKSKKARKRKAKPNHPRRRIIKKACARNTRSRKNQSMEEEMSIT